MATLCTLIFVVSTPVTGNLLLFSLSLSLPGPWSHLQLHPPCLWHHTCEIWCVLWWMLESNRQCEISRFLAEGWSQLHATVTTYWLSIQLAGLPKALPEAAGKVCLSPFQWTCTSVNNQRFTLIKHVLVKRYGYTGNGQKWTDSIRRKNQMSSITGSKTLMPSKAMGHVGQINHRTSRDSQFRLLWMMDCKWLIWWRYPQQQLIVGSYNETSMTLKIRIIN